MPRTSSTVLALLISIATATAEPIEPSTVHVVDGDTIRISGWMQSVRLVGFNAPETEQAQCEAERNLGSKATLRLRELVRAGDLDLELVPCACPAGTEETLACNYGRRCGTLRADSRDVGAILIAEGLAVPFVCSGTRCPKTPRPWCQGRSHSGNVLVLE